MTTLRVALTGGIATGKSHCLRSLAARGAPVIDADRLAHEAIAAGTPGHAEAVARFGDAILASDGEINRAILGRIVFGSTRDRRDLEAIIHPRVYRAIEQWFAALGDRGTPYGIADIPLLYETGREIDFDVVIVAACPESMQLERLMARGGLSLDDARQRLASQTPIAEKADRADYVIDTSGSFEETEAQVERVVGELTARG